MSLQIVKSFGLDFIHIFCQTLNIKKRFTKRISFLSLSNQETDLEYWHIQDFGFCRFEILKQKDFYRGHSFQHNSWMNPKSKIILCLLQERIESELLYKTCACFESIRRAFRLLDLQVTNFFCRSVCRVRELLATGTWDYAEAAGEEF